MSYSPEPFEVHVLEIGGPEPLPIGEGMLFEPGMACSLLPAFQLDPDANWAELRCIQIRLARRQQGL